MHSRRPGCGQSSVFLSDSPLFSRIDQLITYTTPTITTTTYKGLAVASHKSRSPITITPHALLCPRGASRWCELLLLTCRGGLVCMRTLYSHIGGGGHVVRLIFLEGTQ